MLGLDIGNNSIKIVQLENLGDRFTLVAAGIASSVGGGIMGTENDLKLLAENIKKLISNTKISTNEVNLSIPESQAFTRLIKLPYLTDEEVVSAISWQAEPYIPIPIQDAILSHVILDRQEPNVQGQGGVDVLLVASPKNIIQKYLKVAELAGLKVLSIETELIAMARSLSPVGVTCVVVDLGALTTDIAIVRNKQVVVSRSITTAGTTLTRAISLALSVNTEQAENYKKAYGLDPIKLDGKLVQSIAPVYNEIIEEVKKSIQYYKTEIKRDDPIVLAMITGGGSGIPGLVPYMSEKLGIEIVIGDPFSNIAKDPVLAQTLAVYGPLYSVAVGLAQNI